MCGESCRCGCPCLHCCPSLSLKLLSLSSLLIFIRLLWTLMLLLFSAVILRLVVEFTISVAVAVAVLIVKVAVSVSVLVAVGVAVFVEFLLRKCQKLSRPHRCIAVAVTFTVSRVAAVFIFTIALLSAVSRSYCCHFPCWCSFCCFHHHPRVMFLIIT